MGSCACARFGVRAVCSVLVLVITLLAGVEGRRLRRKDVPVITQTAATALGGKRLSERCPTRTCNATQRGHVFARILPADSKCLGSRSPPTPTSPATSSTSAPHIDTAPALLLNAGAGTTGTREIFRLFCSYGIPSVHYLQHCNLRKTIRNKVLRLHFRVMSLWNCAASADGEVGDGGPRTIRGHQCIVHVDPAMAAPGTCVREYMRQRLLEALRGLITSGVVGLADTPYPQLLHEVLALAPNVQVFHTNRAPLDWAQSRLRDHRSDLMCHGTGEEMSLGGIQCPGEGETEGCGDGSLAPIGLQHEGKLDAMARALEQHDHEVARVVPRGQLHQACAWDDNLHSAEVALVALGYTRADRKTSFVTDPSKRSKIQLTKAHGFQDQWRYWLKRGLRQ